MESQLQPLSNSCAPIRLNYVKHHDISGKRSGVITQPLLDGLQGYVHTHHHEVRISRLNW